MGCCSSKNTSDEDDTKGEDGSKKTKNTEAEPRERFDSFGSKKQERCATDDDVVKVVEEALCANFELITFNEFKDYISARYDCEADESVQDATILKVIGEQFVKGCLAIKQV